MKVYIKKEDEGYEVKINGAIISNVAGYEMMSREDEGTELALKIRIPDELMEVSTYWDE